MTKFLTGIALLLILGTNTSFTYDKFAKETNQKAQSLSKKGKRVLKQKISQTRLVIDEVKETKLSNAEAESYLKLVNQ